MQSVFHERLIFESSDLRVLDVRCFAPAGHTADEESTDFEVVLPIAGAFSRRAGASTAVMDALAGYASAPGVEQRVVHASGGDRCLALLPSPRLADEMGLDTASASSAWILRRRRTHLRALTTAWLLSSGDDTLAAECGWMAALAPMTPSQTTAWSSATAVVQRRAVNAVREAMASDPGRRWTLRTLSAVAGYAPHHLSRLFVRHTGMSVTEYRDGVRLAQAVALLTDGMPASAVAAVMGFADQGHLTRRVRQHLGVVPSMIGRASP